MPFLLIALLLAALALLAAPAPRADSEIDPSPWPMPIVRVASLGRPYAAADVSWLKAVQLLGSDSYAAANHPQLETWIDLITRLDPTFEEPYFFGAVLLVTDRERAPDIDRSLARGEAAFPDRFAFPMMRGFLAQFGLIDAQAAAEHYRRAAAKPNAPAYVRVHAEKLAKEGASCGSIMSDLKDLTAGASAAQAKTIAEQRFDILEHCLARLIERTAVSLRLGGKTASGAFATFADVESELGAPVPRPPDRCWQLEADKASLRPCAGSAPARAPGATP